MKKTKGKYKIKPPTGPQPLTWSLYLLVNEKTPNTYLGVSTDPLRRLRQHNGLLARGAKYTHSFGENWRIVLLLPFLTKSKAHSIERICKNKRHKAKGKTPLARRLYVIYQTVDPELCITFMGHDKTCNL